MDVYVIGYACHPPAEKVLTKRLEEMVYDTSAQALRAAAIERGELDHITIAACDELDGRSISNMLMVAPAGGYLKDELRVTDSAMVGCIWQRCGSRAAAITSVFWRAGTKARRRPSKT